MSRATTIIIIIRYKRHGAALLDGLPLPERTVVPTGSPVRRVPVRTVVVRPGDCLWSIAARDLGPGASDAAVDARWRAIYAANHALVGPDPDWSSRGNDSASQKRAPRKGRVMTAVSESAVSEAIRFPVAPATPVASVQGTLALDLGPGSTYPSRTCRADQRGSGSTWSPVDLVRRRRFEQHAARIGAAVVEIVGGDRPVSQLLRWTTPEVYQDLARRAHLVAAAVGRRPGSRRRPVGPPAPGRRPHQLRLRAMRRGQPARAVRPALPRCRGQVRADPRPVAGRRPWMLRSARPSPVSPVSR